MRGVDDEDGYYKEIIKEVDERVFDSGNVMVRLKEKKMEWEGQKRKTSAVSVGVEWVVACLGWKRDGRTRVVCSQLRVLASIGVASQNVVVGDESPWGKTWHHQQH